MSKETSAWLNTNTLIGFTEKRGHAWHYRAVDQGDQSNHYPDAIPVDDVVKRLFYWTPEEVTVQWEREIITEDGVEIRKGVDNTRKLILRPDYPLPGRDFPLGMFKEGYKIHKFEEWLIRNVKVITDRARHGASALQVGSAGLLQDGAVAWVQFELPETLQHAGVAFRPHLTAATSLNGTLASGYHTGSQLVVCDNTLSASLGSADSIVKRRHTRHSLNDIESVREALGISIETVADDFIAQIEKLTNYSVSESEWNSFVELHFPTPKDENKRGTTRAQNNRAKLNTLWFNDPMVAPLAGTAFGVLQAVNTFEHHHTSLKSNTNRGEANMLRVVKGEHDSLDRSTIDELNKVFKAKRRALIKVGE